MNKDDEILSKKRDATPCSTTPCYMARRVVVVVFRSVTTIDQKLICVYLCSNTVDPYFCYAVEYVSLRRTKYSHVRSSGLDKLLKYPGLHIVAKEVTKVYSRLLLIGMDTPNNGSRFRTALYILYK